MKYLLEITADGVEEYELFSRLLMLKNQKKTLGYKAMSNACVLSEEILTRLDQTRNELKWKQWNDFTRMAEAEESTKNFEMLDMFIDATL